MGKTALVLVHKEFLINQWRERIQEFLPNAKIGIVWRDKLRFTGKDIVLCMMQSLLARKYVSRLYKWPGLLVIDECHRAGAPKMNQTVRLFNADHRLGLSATPTRKDKADNVFLYHASATVY